MSWQVYLGAFSISYASFGNGSAKLSTSVWRLPLAFMFLTAKLGDLIQMGADEQIGQSLAGRFANFPANEFHRMGPPHTLHLRSAAQSLDFVFPICSHSSVR